MIQKLSFIAVVLLITLQSASAVRQTEPRLILTDCPVQGLSSGKGKEAILREVLNQVSQGAPKLPLARVLHGHENTLIFTDFTI